MHSGVALPVHDHAPEVGERVSEAAGPYAPCAHGHAYDVAPAAGKGVSAFAKDGSGGCESERTSEAERERL